MKAELSESLPPPPPASPSSSNVYTICALIPESWSIAFTERTVVPTGTSSNIFTEYGVFWKTGANVFASITSTYTVATSVLPPESVARTDKTNFLSDLKSNGWAIVMSPTPFCVEMENLFRRLPSAISYVIREFSSGSVAFTVTTGVPGGSSSETWASYSFGVKSGSYKKIVYRELRPFIFIIK